MLRVIIFFIVILLSQISHAEFKVDIRYEEILSELDVLTINSLGVGESAYVNAWTNFCKLPNGTLGIPKNTKLETERSEYGTYLKIFRKPGGKLSISIPSEEKDIIPGIRSPSKKLDKLHDLIASIIKSEFCNHPVIMLDQADTFIIDDIEGKQSIKELIEEYKGIKRTTALNSVKSVESEYTWIVDTKISPIDDSTNVYLTLYANETVSGLIGHSERPVLVLRCKENKTEAYVITGMSIYNEQVTLRFDGGKAYTENFSKSIAGKALLFPNPIANIKKMVKHKKMLFRFNPFYQAPQAVIFNISGLPEKIESLRKACHW